MQPSTSCHIRQRSVWTVDVAVVGVTKFDDRNAALLYGSGLSWPFISDWSADIDISNMNNWMIISTSKYQASFIKIFVSEVEDSPIVSW